jgi:hypothetical protein
MTIVLPWIAKWNELKRKYTMPGGLVMAFNDYAQDEQRKFEERIKNDK